MAQRIDYDVKPTPIGPTARDELDRLLETLHERGALRLANDLVGANDRVFKVLIDGLSKEGSLNAIQNLSILGMALSRIPPSEFYKVVFALKGACHAVGQYKPSDKHDEAPGVTGAYKMLHDDDLWGALMPIIEGLKTFASQLDTEVDKPITAFSGKPSAN
ncbi:DUF1641 domain-containing protein [Stutzerimonas nitrititolerans]|uniref:DUF1641 domain-containing protein n=1 Tax=Stutzerimonas nitrititolerans TaxID=2482751 RepID=UPI000ECBB218|nr:DUF1641 domain-containing protein [Stutzerimonas nitrititolerans]MBA1186147.1 DUF1641 domain-containing protein [Stutzerimonas stutzeri]HCL76839.1 hypothetical protein [Pseudomonas sp.]